MNTVPPLGYIERQDFKGLCYSMANITHDRKKSEYEGVDLMILGKNVKAQFILICGLGPNAYHRISSCTTAK
ncbi:hypothetical protein H5410_041169 [Solanum commersonii]|uniref:Uncharacterized protein n=1 Tax=Solanum commersonii TaxID=4109 RepID=A0A9J5XSX0_SOLCO|nr:hypothetical protein H5410_041169 [Solanum commersonii]